MDGGGGGGEWEQILLKMINTESTARKVMLIQCRDVDQSDSTLFKCCLTTDYNNENSMCFKIPLCRAGITNFILQTTDILKHYFFSHISGGQKINRIVV